MFQDDLLLVTATCSSPFRENHRHLFSQSYETNLPSSLDWVLPTHLRLLSESTCDGSRYGHEGSFQTRFSLAPGIDKTLHTQSYSYIHLLLLIIRLQRLLQLTCVCLSRSVSSLACVAARTSMASEY